MTRRVRVVTLSLAGIVAVTSLTGCGAVHSVLGIHEAPRATSAVASTNVDQAEQILTRAFTASQQGERTAGAASATAHKTAYTGEALRAATARVRLAKLSPVSADSPILAPEQPRLLAVSRGFGYPRVIVAQTVGAEGSLPTLHLLTSPDARTPYRITASATMLLGSSVKAFDALGKGSPLVTDATDLAVSDSTLLKTYAAHLAFPAKNVSNPPFASDAFSAQLRVRAAAVAKAVKTQGSFSQVHKVVPGSTYAVQQANGDALVFGVIQRTDSFAVKSGQAINTVANKAFVVFSGKKKITKRAFITTLEFVVFAVPRAKGPAILLAASEQVVAGSGS